MFVFLYSVFDNSLCPLSAHLDIVRSSARQIQAGTQASTMNRSRRNSQCETDSLQPGHQSQTENQDISLDSSFGESGTHTMNEHAVQRTVHSHAENHENLFLSDQRSCPAANTENELFVTAPNSPDCFHASSSASFHIAQEPQQAELRVEDDIKVESDQSHEPNVSPSVSQTVTYDDIEMTYVHLPRPFELTPQLMIKRQNDIVSGNLPFNVNVSAQLIDSNYFLKYWFYDSNFHGFSVMDALIESAKTILK